MKTYGLINMSFEKYEEEWLAAEKGCYEFLYEYVLKTHKKEDIAKFFIRNKDKNRDDYCIEMWEEDEDGEFVEGRDLNTVDLFLKHLDKQ